MWTEVDLCRTVVDLAEEDSNGVLRNKETVIHQMVIRLVLIQIQMRKKVKVLQKTIQIARIQAIHLVLTIRNPWTKKTLRKRSVRKRKRLCAQVKFHVNVNQ